MAYTDKYNKIFIFICPNEYNSYKLLLKLEDKNYEFVTNECKHFKTPTAYFFNYYLLIGVSIKLFGLDIL